MTRCLYARVGVILPLMFVGSSCGSAARSDEFLAGRQMGVIQSDVLREVSGIAASRRNPGVLWVHNDSGDRPRLYAIDTKGNLLGICNVGGATNRDWEDIAVGPGPDPNQQYLYIGDIGDNSGKRPNVIVYRVAEPKIDSAAPFGQMAIGPAEAITLTYPDGPGDAETLLVDPLTRDIYVISKRTLFSKVYRAAFPQSITRRTTMERVAVLPWGFATGGDVSPDGRRVIVRGMFNASLWERPAGEPLWRAFLGKQVQIPLANEPQGEAICFEAEGKGYFTISEMSHPPLYYFAHATAPTPKEPAPAGHQ